MKFCRQAGWLAVSFLLLWTHCGADTVELPLTDDAYINANKPDLNTGTREWIVVHKYGPKYGLVRFNAASIAGQEVSEATLTLYLNSLASNGTISVHAITSGWNEATVTWNNQPPAETTATAIVNLTTAEVESVIAIDVTAAVQRWADGSLADAGFLIITNEDIKAIFDAKEMAGGVPATLTVETGEPAYTGEAIVLDFTNPDDCVIDEPGYYVLDRSWHLGDTQSDVVCTSVEIVDPETTLDLLGHEIRGVSGVPTIHSFVKIEIRNGSIIGDPDAIDAGQNENEELTVDNVKVSGDITAGFGTITNSEISDGTAYLSVCDEYYCDDVLFTNNRMLRCRNDLCLIVSHTDWDFIANNYFEGGVLTDWNDGSVITHNRFQLSRNSPTPAIQSMGGRDTIAWNVIHEGANTGTGIRIGGEYSGGRTVVDSNIIRGTSVGIEFVSDGNFYGGNRVSATSPYVGLEGQIDWGGNVSF